MPDDMPPPGHLSEAEVRAIAERLLQERCAPPPASPDEQLLAERYELSPADEERVDAALVTLMDLPPESTIRAEGEAGQDAGGPEDLASAVAENRRRFLETELAVGNTMLDAAVTTRDLTSRARRVARAQEAQDEVARHLARDEPPGFTAAEREELSAGLAQLTARLVGAG